MSIVLENCDFSYPGTGAGVRGVSLAAEDGELITLIGASGSGKTTILKLVAGFERPSAGKISVCGRDMTGIPARKRGIGVVFQSYALFPMMNCLDNVAYPLKIRGIAHPERRRRAGAMLDRVGLPGLGDRYPAQLSGGQQQRVALARALVFNPSVLLLDEPLSAVDAGLRTELRRQIRLLQREHRITALHVTHDREEALSLGDRVALLDGGRIVQCARPQEIYDAPVNRMAASFVGQANLWNGLVIGPDRVQVPFGELRCDAKAFKPGDQATVLVRPENIRSGPGHPAGVNHFQGHLALDSFLGSTRRFEFVPDGSAGFAILGETPDRAPMRDIYIPENRIRLLPHESA